MTRRYDQYPLISAALRDMSDGQRQTVAYWHGMLIAALEGYLPCAREEVRREWSTAEMRQTAAEGARVAVQGWLNVMRDVAAVISDPSEADWCCKPGMLASPDPCPQHGFDSTGNYDLGTVISRPALARADGALVRVRERAVLVAVADGYQDSLWRSVEYSTGYRADQLGSEWTVVGHA